SFGSCPLSPHAFVHNHSKSLELSSNPFDSSCIMHTAVVVKIDKKDKSNLTSLFFRGSLVVWDLEGTPKRVDTLPMGTLEVNRQSVPLQRFTCVAFFADGKSI